MNAIQKLYSRRDELKAEVEKMAGRKGVAAMRTELDTLNARLTELDFRRRQMKANVNRDNATPRQTYQVENTRRQLEILAQASIKRGYYQELAFATPDRWYPNTLLEHLAAKCPTHPNARPFTAWTRANVTLKAAIADGVIESAHADFDEKHRGTATNHDMYSYSADGTLILVQVRHAEATKYGTNVRVQYFVTDGDDAVEIVKGKANIKKAAQADPSPDSPLRYLRAQLKAEWRAKIDEQPVKLAAPKVAEYTVYKILHKDGDTLKSVYSGEEYRLGVRKQQKAADEHRGGYYAFLSAEKAIEIAETGNVFHADWTSNKTLVLCKGRAYGTPVVYSNGKRSFSRIVIDEVVKPLG